MNLSEFIKNKVESGIESDTIDFKREWYKEDQKLNLVHDIICLANNPYSCNSYIIIGYDESEEGIYEKCVGVDENCTNRRDTKRLNDVFRSLVFTNNSFPKVRVEHVYCYNVMLDIIVIENSYEVPFILSHDYPSAIVTRKLHKHFIYSRVYDQNTPINNSCDFEQQERLWKKRFRLSDTLEYRFEYYLSAPSEWMFSKGDDELYYHDFDPLFNVILDRYSSNAKSIIDPLLDLFNGEQCDVFWIDLVHNKITMDSYPAVIIGDSVFRSVLPTLASPLRNPYNRLSDLYYLFIDKDSMLYVLYDWINYIFNTDVIQVSDYLTLKRYIIFFENAQERQDFNQYLKKNAQQIENEINEKIDKLKPILSPNVDWSILRKQLGIYTFANWYQNYKQI